MTQARRRFHEELEALERELIAIGTKAQEMVGKAVDALRDDDHALANEVIEADDDIDERYLRAHHDWLEIMALQTPVAIDLRLMSALLHLSVTLERMGDQAVNIAKMVHLTHGLPRKETIVTQLAEMADIVRSMARTALDAFAGRKLELALRLPEMDDPVDRLNRNMIREVIACADDPELLEWAIRMMMVSRALERVGDQSVDIGEQAAFLITGEFREFGHEAPQTVEEGPVVAGDG